jgi:hypothetical protein
MILTGENRRTRRKTYPSATLFTTNRILTKLGEDLGPRGEMPVTNRLSYGSAKKNSKASGYCGREGKGAQLESRPGASTSVRPEMYSFTYLPPTERSSPITEGLRRVYKT